MMLTTADLPAALRLDPTAPHACGRANCPDSDTAAHGAEPREGVASQG